MSERPELNSVDLVAQWRCGDQSAASEIFDRYVSRLVGLARTRLSAKLRRRIDPEDVVQSAYRSFFRRTGEGELSVDRSGDLWRLLAAITIRKVLGQVERQHAAKRMIGSEDSLSSDACSAVDRASDEPTADEAVALIDALEAFMASLDPLDRRILELRLQDASTDEIAEAVDRSPRTVRRAVERMQADLTASLGAS